MTRAAPQEFALRFAVPADVPTILDLIRRLAEFERLANQCIATEELLHAHLFGAQAYAEVIIAERQDEPVGFALFFHTFSTFLCRPGIYLEDLFVRTEWRGSGVGRALLQRLARLAIDRGCGRLEWTVLDWNEGAIGFYRRIGAEPLDDWTTFRLTGESLAALAGGGTDVL